MAYWLDQLLDALREFYPENAPQEIVGYLKGSGDRNVWRIKAMQQKPQHMILGSVPPTRKDWIDAGKPYDEPIQTVHPNDLHGLIILYGGGSPRPWGRIEILDADALKYYQTSTIDHFRQSFARH